MNATPNPAGHRLAGKTVIVSGAGNSADGPVSIGSAIARTVAQQGGNVVVFDVSETAAAVTLAAIESDGGTASLHQGDVCSPDDCAGVVEAAGSTFGSFDGLVNCAAVLPASQSASDDLDDWHRVIDINLLGPTLMSEAAAPVLAKEGGGAIVNISSVSSLRGMGGGAYTSAKGGMNSMTIEHAYQWGRQGIRVNCVLPGHVYAPMGDHPHEVREVRRKSSLLGVEGTAWHIATAVAFLLSDDAQWITGVLLPVDGGATATSAMPMYGYMTE
jgi:NAD(P)-dependent dehydrogenase (short-subunit alcohol dehydrogenase family)